MKWIIGLLCLFFLVIFHEFGHFIAAKIFGVKVESFSVGFGPILLHKTIKGTDYRLSLLPLGGYCGMKGEKDFQKALEENLPQIQADPDSLYGVHPFKRALIALAGPFFNFILGILFFAITNCISYKYTTYSNKIIIADELYENMSTKAREAGLLTGDIIIQINDIIVEDFSSIIEEISSRPGETVDVTILRDDNKYTFKVNIDTDEKDGTGKIGIAADQDSVIEKEVKGDNFFVSIKNGFIYSIEVINLTFQAIKKLFNGANLKDTLGGPIRTTALIGETAKESFSYNFKIGILNLSSVLAIISISLFIMNLLPIPLLDGGIILFAFIEMILNKKISPKKQYYIQFIGLAFITILFIIGLTCDISYFVNRGK